ncbi:MAG TPA: type II secretion system major pseudopilin GspG [Rectinemataceae bacterium]|nr:type II secretion system major pseudopilin GspG [Rectinemataceae bacterium]
MTKHRSLKPTGREDAWTFIETLIVITIILILTSAVGFAAFRYIDQARVAATKSQIETLSTALNSYFFDCGIYPTQDQGLSGLWIKPAGAPDTWKGPYLQKPVPNDSWGRPFEYTVPGPNGLPFGIRSLGSDGAEGGDGSAKDLSSWE